MFRGKYAVWNWSDLPPMSSSCGISVPWRKTKWPFNSEQLEIKTVAMRRKPESCGLQKTLRRGLQRPFCFPSVLVFIRKQHTGWGQESWHRRARSLDCLPLGTECREIIQMLPRLPSMGIHVTKCILKFLLYALPHPTVCSKVPERIQWGLPCLGSLGKIIKTRETMCCVLWAQ